MVFEGSSVAISHTGKVRSNNQDSGYSGANLFVVADGMGGHAGGDVASTIAVGRMEGLDRPYTSTDDAQADLQAAATSAAADLVRASKERPELAGLGTTLCAIIMVDDYAVIGHIGDSRIYLFRDEELTQITTDHTFVQRLVDSGRITLEEARYHPRRSVLMRVLSDMDIAPDLDMFVMPTLPGDRWLLCSDGLSGVVDDPHIAKAMAQGLAPGRTADILLKQALDGGAPDNVTMVIVDVGGAHPLSSGTGTIVGAASNPADLPVPAPRASLTSWLHPGRQAANEPSHFEPDSDDFFEEIIEEDRRRARRRRVAWLVALLLALGALVGTGFVAYNWTQTRYFVGADEDSVVIYRGVQQSIGPFSLSTEVKDTGILLADLNSYQRASVERTINARSLADATAITERLAKTILPLIPNTPAPENTPETDTEPSPAEPSPAATTEAPAP